MTTELNFRKSNEQDLARISEFRKSFFPYNSSIRCCEPEYYRWKCYHNPIQQGETWLAEHNEIIVGTKSITPKRMKVLGTVINGAETGDAFTHTDYQRRGISAKLSMSAQESMFQKGISLIYGVPGKKTALPSYEKKLNRRRVPIKLRNLMKPLNMKQLLEARLHIPHLLAAFLSPTIRIVSDTTTRIGAIGSAKSSISITRVSSFPDDIDVFGEQAAKSYDIMLVRSQNYLEWRYIENPDTYSILLATNNEGATVGYMVIKVGSYSGIPVGFIVDFLTLEDNQGIFKKLLLTSLEELCQRRVNIVYTWAVKGSFYDKTLLRFGFLPYRKITLQCYQNKLGSQLVGKNYKWHFTMGDSDSI